jgi:hypothetical protein
MGRVQKSIRYTSDVLLCPVNTGILKEQINKTVTLYTAQMEGDLTHEETYQTKTI